jgi:hypothetical protein
MTKTMTDRRRNRAPMRRSSTPERILSAGLATATCVGVVGLLGARTIEANATSASEPSTEQVESAQASDPTATAVLAEPTTASGLTQADLDAYAAALAKEKDRLDAYRAKLVRTAKKLKRQIAARNAAVATVPSRPAQSARPAQSTPKAQSARPAQSTPKAPAAKPAPQPAAAPAPAPAPKPQPKPQSNTKSS